MGKVKDMGVVNQIREKTKEENVQGIMQTKKMNEHKKRFDKLITMMCAHKRKDNKQIFRRKMMIEKQRKLKDMRRMNKEKKLK